MEIEIESPLVLWFVQEIPSPNWVEFMYVKYFGGYVLMLGGSIRPSKVE